MAQDSNISTILIITAAALVFLTSITVWKTVVTRRRRRQLDAEILARQDAARPVLPFQWPRRAKYNYHLLPKPLMHESWTFAPSSKSPLTWSEIQPISAEGLRKNEPRDRDSHSSHTSSLDVQVAVLVAMPSPSASEPEKLGGGLPFSSLDLGVTEFSSSMRGTTFTIKHSTSSPA